MTLETLCNDGQGPLKVPGFNGLSICFELPFTERFANYADEDLPAPLTVRELGMLRFMNEITEIHDWHLKVFDEDIVAGWGEKASKKHLMTNNAWDWCLTELRDKAKEFEQTSRVLVLNTSSGICKADLLLSIEFQINVAPLLVSPNNERDAMPAPSGVSSRHLNALLGRGSISRDGKHSDRWGAITGGEPSTHNQMVRHVDPSLYPLVYGRTRAMAGGGEVRLDRFLDSYGSGSVAPLHEEAELEMYSSQFQWLPCEIGFLERSGIKITSYINNLHPTHYKSLYGSLTKLISSAIESWDEVLVKGTRGQRPARIRTWGVEWTTKPGDGWPSSEELLKLEENREGEAFKSMVSRIHEYLLWPEDHPVAATSHPFPNTPIETNSWEHFDGGLEYAIKEKWKRLRKWEYPEVGVSFTYSQWKEGRTGNAIVKLPSPVGVTRSDPDHDLNPILLRDQFKDQGLQVVVELNSVELTPDNCSYTDDMWNVAGNGNEHIVASAIYFYDVSNVTTPRISFQQATRMIEEDLNYDPDLSEALAAIFGLNVDDMDASLEYSGTYRVEQDMGSVSATEGRLVAWPNTLQHTFETLELLDKTKKGHARSISLSLVDPHYRICSTRNIPPQRHDWWAEEALKEVGILKKGFPQEVVDMIQDATDHWPMGMTEAKDLREEMAAETLDKNLWFHQKPR